ncbi:hypothetical protein ABFX02_10G139200 [Erythranthe guttata]
MSSFDSQRQESVKRTNHSTTNYTAPPNFQNYKLAPTINIPVSSSNPKTLLQLPAFSGGFDGDLVAAAAVPPVTVVLEGRSICQRISLHKHGSYQSLAWALRQMFVDIINYDNTDIINNDGIINNLDISNAVPGHLVAYEDMENDLLLVGDLNWKDFVRVAKRIRILPAKANSRKKKDGIIN